MNYEHTIGLAIKDRKEWYMLTGKSEEKKIQNEVIKISRIIKALKQQHK